MEKLLAREVTIFPEKIKVLIFYLKKEEAIYSQLSIAKKRQIGYLQSPVNSQKTLNWLSTVNCH